MSAIEQQEERLLDLENSLIISWEAFEAPYGNLFDPDDVTTYGSIEKEIQSEITVMGSTVIEDVTAVITHEGEVLARLTTDIYAPTEP